MAAKMESVLRKSHSTFVKSDLQKFDLESDLAATDLPKHYFMFWEIQKDLQKNCNAAGVV
jgi:hypothetical protein